MLLKERRISLLLRSVIPPSRCLWRDIRLCGGLRSVDLPQPESETWFDFVLGNPPAVSYRRGVSYT